MKSKKPKSTVNRATQQEAMRELWGKSDEFLRTNVVGLEEQRFPRAITPGGVEIVQVADSLRVSARFAKTVGGKAVMTTTRVEFPADIRELPEVYEDWYREGDSGTSTVPVRDFRVVADTLLALFEDTEQTSSV